MTILLIAQRGVVPGLIRLQQRGMVDHCSMLFSDGVLIEATWPKVRKVAGWEPACEKRAVRIERYRLAVRKDVERLIEEMVREFAERQVGKGYDLSSVLRFVSRRQADRKAAGKWFCSEFVFAALREGGMPLFERSEPWEISPAMLRRSPFLLPELEGRL